MGKLIVIDGLDGSGLLGLNIVVGEVQGLAGVEDVLQNDDMTVAKLDADVLGDDALASGLGAAVGRDTHEVDLAVVFKVTDEICKENNDTTQNTDKNRVLALIFFVDLCGDFLDAGLNLLLSYQDFSQTFFKIDHNV